MHQEIAGQEIVGLRHDDTTQSGAAFGLKPRGRFKKINARLIATVLTGALVVGVPLAVVESTVTAVVHQAEAAITNGAQLDGEYGRIGNFLETSTGLYIYCIDSSADWPSGQTFPGWGTPVTALDSRPGAGSPVGVSGLELGRMNWIVSNFGQTSDPVQAAAVQISLFAFTKGSVAAAKAYIGYADGYAAQISALVDNYMAAANAAVTGAAPSTGTGQLTFTTDHTNNYNGTLTVSNLSPAGATGTVTLTNGVFTATGTNTISGVGNGAVLDIRGTVPGEDPLYQISATGTFDQQVWGNSINVADYGGSGQQRMVVGGGPSRVQFSLNATDPQFRTSVFRPAGTTVVPLGVIAKGEEMGDVLQPTTVADETGLNNPWRQLADGRYLPVTYKATAYLVPPADYPTDPAGVFEIPASAVEVASTTVTTGDLGPTTTYPYSLGEAPGPGMFVIVIAYNREDQTESDLSRFTLMFTPEDYSWRDNFGQHAESILVPEIRTKAKPDYLPGEMVWDDYELIGIVPEGGLETIIYSYAQKPGIKTPAELEKAGGAICEPENLINETEPVLLEEAGSYRSTPFRADTAKDVIIQHVEVTVLPGTETIVSEGECGDVAEMTLPRQPLPSKLPNTGQPSSVTEAGGLVGGGLLALGALLVATGFINKKRKNRAGAAS